MNVQRRSVGRIACGPEYQSGRQAASQLEDAGAMAALMLEEARAHAAQGRDTVEVTALAPCSICMKAASSGTLPCSLHLQLHDCCWSEAQTLNLVPWAGNFIGVVFARSLHFQFWAWYAQQLPLLLWQVSPALFGCAQSGAAEG